MSYKKNSIAPKERSISIVRRYAAAALVFLGSGLAAGTAWPAANIVANGSFESPAVNGQSQTFNAGSTALAPWTIGGNSIDVINKFWTSSDGAQSIDLDGNAPGSIAQKLTTVAGRTYTLTFKYSSHPSLGSNPASMVVMWGPDGGAATVSRSFTFAGPSTKSNMNWQTGTLTVQATSALTVLTFRSVDGTNQNYGIALDDVRVTTRDQAALSVAVTPSSLAYGQTANASASGGSGTGAVTFSAGASTGCAVSGSTVSVTNASGSCAITATKAADAEYDAITSPAVTVALARASQATLSVTGPASLQFGVAGTATASGGSGSGALTFAIGTSTGCALAGTALTVVDANGTCSLTAAKAGDSNYLDATSTAFSVALPRPLATPVLFRAVTTDSITAYLVGRADGASSLPITVQAFTATSCADGALVAGGVAAGAPVATTTDPTGYFGASFPGVPAGSFVAIQIATPTHTARSACMVSSADNDAWPKALNLIGDSVAARDYIDAPGRARWYRFDVLPGQRIQVLLSGLPGDYDLAVFKDIGAAFLAQLAPTSATQLVKLSAEYAPSVFSPSVFSPSVFSPSVFSPDAYAPSVFSPSVFSPSVFSPSVFSPSVFSPSVFSPSVFSPSVFSPSVFSPSVFSPSVFSPSVFSPSVFSADELAQAFSSAQTRSIIGVSATPGSGDEFVVVNTWSNTGSFYVRVAGRAGAYSTAGQFTIGIAKGATSCANVTDTRLAPRAPAGANGYDTIILTDSTRLALGTVVDAATGATLQQKLQALAGSAGLKGAIVDVGLDPRVQALKAQAGANAACPYATNLVAEEIKGIVDSYATANPLRFVVIAGNDGTIPFFRYPDQSLLGQESGYVPPVKSDSASDASLRLDYVLSQDAYGAGTRISLRTSAYPVPGLAVGRLVETPAEIAGMIDAYLAANGVVTPGSSLVTGYDFLADAAGAVRSELGQGTGTAVDSLIAPNNISPQDPAAWTATALGAKLLSGGRHDVIFLAGHFSANSALAADFTTSLLTTDLAASSANFTNSIVFSAGCHSGYNLVDADAIPGVTLPLDWAQAFAQKKATLIAGTGYQYGDTDFIEYSERLYADFARQLRAGTGVVAVGEALVKAKLDYLAATPDIRGIHEKALLEATLFGLPMLGVNMPAGRGLAAGPGAPTITPIPVATQPALSLGLKTADLHVAPTLARNTTPLTNVEPSAGIPGSVFATWFSGPQGVVTNPAEPALPLAGYNVTAVDSTLVLRGVGFRGGRYADSSVIPLTGAPTNELRGVHVPFVSPVFYPMRPWTVNYFGALSGNGSTRLLVTPAQHRAEDIALGTSTLRKFDDLDLRLFYSANLGTASLSDAPTIVRVEALPAGAGATFTAQVVGDPKAAIHGVWITYTGDGLNAWQSVDLTQCVAPVTAPCTAEDSAVWKGTLATLPPNLRFVVQAANGFGLVTLDDNLGVYYGLAGSAQAPTTLALGATPAGATFGDTVPIPLSLKSGSTALAGKSVIVSIGGAARVATTDSAGNATVNVPLVSLPGTYRIIASFGGDAGFLPSSASAGPIAVAKAPTSLAALSLTSATSTLTGTIGGKTQPLMQEAVTFAITGAHGARTIVVITDYLGQARLPPTGLPAGDYTITASFAGNATYAAAATTAQAFTIAPQTITFGGGLADVLPFPGSVTFTATSSSGSPVTVTLVPKPSAYCTLASANGQYTLTSLAVGTCTISASAAGTVTFADVAITRDIAIKTAQAIAFGALADRTFGSADFTITATATSGLAVSFTSLTAPVCTVSGATVHIVAAGTCTIAADQPGNAQFLKAPTVTQSFTVNKAAQAITFPAVAPQQFVVGGAGTFGVAATSSSGLTVAFTSNTTAVCTVVGSTVTMKSAGSCVIAANQAGSINYLPAPEVQQTVTIAKAAQSISFPAIGDRTLDASPLTLTATSLSGTTPTGLPVTFTAAGACTVSGTTLTLTQVGGCTVTASQGGDATYAAAADVAQTFLVHLANVWKATGPMTTARSYHTATRLADGTGRVLVTGGLDVYGAPTASTELYDPATRTFTSAGNMPSKSSSHAAALLNDGRVIVFGGGNSSAQVYTPSTGTWAPAGSLSSNRSYHTATTLPDGRVLIAGGADNAGKTTATTIVYNPTTGAFGSGPTMDTARERHTATLMTVGPFAGKVLIAGGRSKNGNNYTTYGTYQFCDATACTASQGGIAKRHSHAAVELTATATDKDVLLSGGSDGSGDLASSDLYGFDPATATWKWTTTGLFTIARREIAAAELPFAQALVAGGTNGTTPQAAADLFAPPFSGAPPMGVPRTGHTATSLRDAAGNIVGVLVIGGVSTAGKSVGSAETYGMR